MDEDKYCVENQNVLIATLMDYVVSVPYQCKYMLLTSCQILFSNITTVTSFSFLVDLMMQNKN